MDFLLTLVSKLNVRLTKSEGGQRGVNGERPGVFIFISKFTVRGARGNIMIIIRKTSKPYLYTILGQIQVSHVNKRQKYHTMLLCPEGPLCLT